MPGAVVTWRLLFILLLVVLLAGIAIGLALGYHLWHQPAVASTASVRPAVVQSDGSVQLARVPMAEPGPAPHIIPKGAREERRARVVVRPEPLSSNPGSLDKVSGLLDKDHPEHNLEMVCSCDPIAVDLSLVRHRDGSSGIVASADGGTVDPAASIDTPILQDEPADYRRAVGVTWRPSPAGDVYGAIYQQDIAHRLRVGAGLVHEPGDGLRGELQVLLRY